MPWGWSQPPSFSPPSLQNLNHGDAPFRSQGTSTEDLIESGQAGAAVASQTIYSNAVKLRQHFFRDVRHQMYKEEDDKAFYRLIQARSLATGLVLPLWRAAVAVR